MVPSLLAAVGFGVVSYSACGSGVWGCELQYLRQWGLGL